MPPGWLPWKNKDPVSTKQKDSDLSRPKPFPSGLKLLHDGEDCVVDIIFIHGLTGDRERTWRAKTATAPWPQSLLPSKIPNARILTFGYDAYVADWKGVVSNNRIGNHSMNLITSISTYRDNDETVGIEPVEKWEVRSETDIDRMIGLLFSFAIVWAVLCVRMQALVVSQQITEKHLQNVFLTTCGIIFLGTPHNGSGLAQWGKKLAKSLGVLKQTNPKIVEVLERDSEMLSRIQANFHAMIQSRNQDSSRPIQITCFYEELPLLGVGIVVPFHSAIIPGFTPIGIHANHKDMTRFETENDQGFVAVVGEIRRWIKEITMPGDMDNLSNMNQLSLEKPTFSSSQSTVAMSTEASTIQNTVQVFHSNLQRRSVEHFVPRNGVQSELSLFMDQSSQRSVVLYGIGGSGKTQLAIQCCHQAEEKGFIAALWIDASSPATVEDSYRIIAKIIIKSFPDTEDIQALISLTQNTIRSWSQRWLMVFDNYDNPKRFQQKRIKEYIPGGKSGCILFTSRHSGLTSLTSHRILISGMSEPESINLLLQRLPTDQKEEIDAKDIVATLGYLPLALDQAGAYIRARNLPLTEFKLHYQKRKEMVFREIPDDWEYYNEDGPLCVFTTWEMSFDLITGDRETVLWKTDFLTVAAFFDCTKISERYFQSYCDDSRSEWMNIFLTEGKWDSYKMGDIIVELSKLSLIQLPDQVVGQQSFTIHPIVRDWVIHRNEKPRRQWATIELTKMLVTYLRSPAQLEMPVEANQETALHIDTCIMHDADYVESSTGTAIMSLPRTASAFGRFYRKQGRYPESERLMRQALAAEKEINTDDHPDTLAAAESLALLCRRQGNYAEAEELFDGVLAGKEAMLGHNHIDTFRTIQNLGNLYGDQGRYLNAEQFLERALEGLQSNLGKQDLETLGVGQNLANVYRKIGRNIEAQKLYERTLAGKQRQLGPEHPDTLGTAENLANMYRKQGRFADAEQLFKRSFAGTNYKLGPEHPETLRAAQNLANVYSDQDQFDDAEQLYEYALKWNEKQLGIEHPNTLRTMENLANLYSKRGSYIKAERLFQKALVGNNKKKGVDHPDTLGTLENLGVLYYRKGEFEKAGELFEEVLEVKDRRFGQEQSGTLGTLKNLGNAYFKQARFEDAEKQYNKVLKWKEKLEHPDKISTMQNLSAIYRKQGRSEEASQMKQCLLAGKRPLGNLFNGKEVFLTESTSQKAKTRSAPMNDTPIIGQLRIVILEGRRMKPSKCPIVRCQFQGAEIITKEPLHDDESEASSEDYKRKTSSGAIPIGQAVPGTLDPPWKFSFNDRYEQWNYNPSWNFPLIFDVFNGDTEINLHVYDSLNNEAFLGHIRFSPRLTYMEDYSQDWFPLKPRDTKIDKHIYGDILLSVRYDRVDKKTYGPKDVEILSLFATGTYGQVHKIRINDAANSYLMKVVPKKFILTQNSTSQDAETSQIIRPYVLEGPLSPFVSHPKLKFETEAELCVVDNYRSGGELFLLLQKEGRFSEQHAKFYVAEIILGLETLHKHRIYGVLDPACLVLDTFGHISLYDFGMSKVFNESKNFKETIEYIAPEIITGKSGFTKVTDFWSLGVLLFQMSCGWSPFYSEDVDQMYKNISSATIRFPRDSLSSDGRSFIKGLLNRNPKTRLGASFGILELKIHAFFSDIDWEALAVKSVIPPFMPHVPFGKARASEDESQEDMSTLASRLGQTTPFTLGMEAHFKGFTFIDESSVSEHYSRRWNDDDGSDDLVST